MASELVPVKIVKGVNGRREYRGSPVEMAPVDFQYEDIVEYTQSFDKKVGEGGCAIVYQGKIPICNPYNLPKQEVAVKELLTTKKIQHFENEVRWLELFRHEGIVRYIGKCRTAEYFFIVLEYIKKADLTMNIHALNWNETLKILRGIAATISYLHSYDPDPPGRLVIGDLKCANILLDKGNKPKLCDFGSISTEGSRLKDCTPTVTDPHAIVRGIIEQSNDLYCFGVIMLQLIMNEAATAKDGRRIRDIAEEHLETNPHVVHSKLLKSGCSKSDARTITALAMKLTQTRATEEPVGFVKMCYGRAFDTGKKMEIGIPKIRDPGASTSGNENLSSRERLIREMKNDDGICETSSSISGSGSGNGNGNGNRGVNTEEPDRQTIQEAIRELASIKVNQLSSVTSKVVEFVKKISQKIQKMRV